MSQELQGKVAIVTGGANGIGAWVVTRFVAEGARVVIADVDEGAGAELAGGLGDAAAFVRVDVAEAADVEAAVEAAAERFGALDIMVNNAGVSGPLVGFLRDDFASFGQVMNVNLLGVMLGSQRAARYMKEHGGGAIVNCASIAGMSTGAGLAAYRASKAAVIHLSRSLAVELAHHGIRVNCIAPGQIQTDMTTYDMDAVIRMTQPLRRHGTSEDVANAIVFLASDRAAQITGTLLPIDGGTTAGPPADRMRALQATVRRDGE